MRLAPTPCGDRPHRGRLGVTPFLITIDRTLRVTLSTGFCDGTSWSVRWLPATYPAPIWLQRFSPFRWFTFTMAHHVFACATHRFLLGRISGLRLPDTAVYPRFSPLRTSRQTGGYACTSAPEGQGLHLHGDEVTRLKVHLNLVVCPEAGTSFRPTGRTPNYVVAMSPLTESRLR